MTIEEIKASSKPFLNAADVAPVLGCNPHFIRCAAREKPELLGFSTCVMGSKVLIPRKPFLAFIGEDGGDGEESKGHEAQSA